MMYDELIKRLRAAAIMSEALSVFLPHSEGSAVAKLYNEAADAIEELQKAVNFHKFNSEFWEGKYNSLEDEKWIPMTERLPEEMDRSRGEWSAEIRPSDDVLVWLSHEKRQSVAWYSHTYNEWTTVDENTVYCFGEVTHWKPLPEPPKEESNGV